MKNQQFALASLSIIIFLTSSCLVSAKKGSCPGFSGLFQWDPSSFQGTWYLYGTDVAAGYRCQRMLLSYDGRSNTFAMVGFRSATDNQSMKVVANSKFTLKDGTALGIHFIDDHDGFALLYGCKNSGSGTYEETEYIWTRVRQPDTSLLQRISGQSRTRLSSFKLTNQSNCK